MSYGVREGICVFEIVQPKALDEAMKVIIAFDVIAANKASALIRCSLVFEGHQAVVLAR